MRFSCFLCLALCFFLACQRNSHASRQGMDTDEADQGLPFKAMLLLKESGSPKHVLRNNVGPIEPPPHTHPELQRSIIQLERQYPEPEQWPVVNGFVREKLDSIRTEWEMERNHTLDVQGFCYQMIDHYLLHTAMNEIVAQAMEYYMDALLTHRGVDLDVMTRAALALHGLTPPDKWDRYRNYILEQAREDLPAYKSLLEETRSAYRKETNPDQKLWKKALLAQYADFYASARFALQAFEEGG